MPTPAEMREDKEWLSAQGIDPRMIHKLGHRATYYRQEGLAIHNLPLANFYQRQRYRRRGWTMIQPGATKIAASVPVPTVGVAVAPQGPRSLTEAVALLMQGRGTWQGTATELKLELDAVVEGLPRDWPAECGSTS